MCTDQYEVSQHLLSKNGCQKYLQLMLYSTILSHLDERARSGLFGQVE